MISPVNSEIDCDCSYTFGFLRNPKKIAQRSNRTILSQLTSPFLEITGLESVSLKELFATFVM